MCDYMAEGKDALLCLCMCVYVYVCACNPMHITKIYFAKTASRIHFIYAHTRMHTHKRHISFYICFPSFHSINTADINKWRKDTHIF